MMSYVAGRRLAWTMTIVVLSPACTLEAIDQQACISHDECRSAFGWARQCGERGLCEPAPLEARCYKTIPPDLFQEAGQYRDLIVIGSVMDHALYPKEARAVELAVRQANDSGGLDGRSFGLVQCTDAADSSLDDRTEQEAAVDMATYLADTLGVPAIIGPQTSSTTLAAFNAVSPFGTLMLSPSATSTSLTLLDGLSHSDENPGLLWRTVPPDSLQGSIIARYMTTNLNARSVAVIYQAGPYGEGLAQTFAEQFAGNYDFYTFSTGTYRDTVVTEVGHAILKSSAYDQVLFISSDLPDIVAFFNAAGSLDGYTKTDVGIFLTDSAFNTSLLDQVRATIGQALFPRVKGTGLSKPTGLVYEQFKASYAATFSGEDPSTDGFTAHSFDAGWLVIYGAAWAHYQLGSISGIGIASGLRRVSEGESVLIRALDWNTVRASFEVGQSFDVTGASGNLNFDPLTEETSAPIDVWKIDSTGTDFTLVYTYSS